MIDKNKFIYQIKNIEDKSYYMKDMICNFIWNEPSIGYDEGKIGDSRLVITVYTNGIIISISGLARKTLMRACYKRSVIPIHFSSRKYIRAYNVAHVIMNEIENAIKDEKFLMFESGIFSKDYRIDPDKKGFNCSIEDNPGDTSIRLSLNEILKIIENTFDLDIREEEDYDYDED